jgi:protein-tyrosine phosphatase
MIALRTRNYRIDRRAPLETREAAIDEKGELRIRPIDTFGAQPMKHGSVNVKSLVGGTGLPGPKRLCYRARLCGFVFLTGMLGVNCGGRLSEFGDNSHSGLGAAGGRYANDPRMAIGGKSGTDQFADSGIGGSGTATGGSTATGTSACSPERWVLTDEVINARDIGGVPLRDGSISACDKLFRGGPLFNLTPQSCDDFAALGIQTVIDLRIDSERTGTPDAPCVLSHVKQIAAPLPVPYALSPEQYILDLNTYSSIVAAFDAFGDPAAYPIYFHCTYGRDRTGVLAAVILLILGASGEDIYAEYQLTAQSGLYVPPDSLNAVLQNIEQRGGIDAYLAEAGVSPLNIAVLRAQATAP